MKPSKSTWIALAIAAVLVAGCTAARAQGTASTKKSVVTREDLPDWLPRPKASPIPTAAPPAPKANFVLNEGFEYGYQPALSVNDHLAGRVAAALFMVNYLGSRDGRAQVLHKVSSDVVEVYDCALPCQFATIYQFVELQHTSTERMKIEPTSIAGEFFSDVERGLLKPRLFKRCGRMMMGWVEKNGNMSFYKP